MLKCRNRDVRFTIDIYSEKKFPYQDSQDLTKF